jgi:hypothetical protein
MYYSFIFISSSMSNLLENGIETRGVQSLWANSEASPHTLSYSHLALSHLAVSHFTLKMISPLELACWNCHEPKHVFC